MTPPSPRALAGLALGLASCSGGSSPLTPDLEQRFAAEGVVRRADNTAFRYTHDAGMRSADAPGWTADIRKVIAVPG